MLHGMKCGLSSSCSSPSRIPFNVPAYYVSLYAPSRSRGYRSRLRVPAAGRNYTYNTSRDGVWFTVRTPPPALQCRAARVLVVTARVSIRRRQASRAVPLAIKMLGRVSRLYKARPKLSRVIGRRQRLREKPLTTYDEEHVDRSPKLPFPP